MFNIGWTEMLVIAIVLIIVVGPKDLPALLRTFGRTMTQLRSMAGEFRSQFDEALKEAELDDVRKTFRDAKKLNPTRELRDAMNPLRKAGEDLKSDIDRTMRGPAKSDETVAKKDPAAPVKAGGDVASTSKTDASAKPSVGSPAETPVARTAASSANGGTPPGAKEAPAASKPAEPAKAGAAAGKTSQTPAAKKTKPRAKSAGTGSSANTTARRAAPKKAGPTKKAGDA